MDSSMYEYLDLKGDIQGPFPAHWLKNWFEQGLLPPNLKIRQVNSPDHNYFPLKDLSEFELVAETTGREASDKEIAEVKNCKNEGSVSSSRAKSNVPSYFDYYGYKYRSGSGSDKPRDKRNRPLDWELPNKF